MLRDEKNEKNENLKNKSRKISNDSFAGLSNFEISENSDSPVSSDLDDFVDVERDSATSGFSSGTDGKIHENSGKYSEIRLKNATKMEKKGKILKKSC